MSDDNVLRFPADIRCKMCEDVTPRPAYSEVREHETAHWCARCLAAITDFRTALFGE